jgi:acetolactate synthase I/II/III large subunit
MTLWPFVACVLARAGCGVVTGIPSDEPGLLDAALDEPALRVISVRDQRAGGCLAAGHALASGKPAVVALQTGPSFANAQAALLEAASLDAPVVVVTTSVAAHERGRGGFQEAVQLGAAEGYAKWTFRVESDAQLEWAVRRAAYLAAAPPRGVVVLEIAAELAGADHPEPTGHGPLRDVETLRSAPAPAAVGRARAEIARARRPAVIAGGGALVARCGDELAELARRTGAALFVTASGRGAVAESHPQFLGLAGLYAAPGAAAVLERSDLILALGTRLEETARIGWNPGPGTVVVQADVDPARIGRSVPADVALLGDARLALDALLAHGDLGSMRPAWTAELAAARAAALDGAPWSSFERSRCAATLRALAGRPEIAAFVYDNGLHDMWAYLYPVVPLGAGQRVFGPGEQTMMGFAAAAAGGVAAALGGVVAVVNGDGAFAMSSLALPTVAANGGRVLYVVFDNAGFGWPRLSRSGRARGALTEFAQPVPVQALCESAGGTYRRVRAAGDVPAAVGDALAAARAGGVGVVHVPVLDSDVPPLPALAAFAHA